MSGDISSAVFQLASELDRAKDDGESNRRLILRRALRDAHERGWSEGYADGLQDGGATSP